MSLDDIDDFNPVLGVAEKDQLAFEREAADIGTKIRPWPSQRSQQRGEFLALLTKLIDDPPADCWATSLLGDEFEDSDDVTTSRR